MPSPKQGQRGGVLCCQAALANMDCLEMEKHTRKSGGFLLALSQHATVQKIPAIMATAMNHGQVQQEDATAKNKGTSPG